MGNCLSLSGDQLKPESRLSKAKRLNKVVMKEIRKSRRIIDQMKKGGLLSQEAAQSVQADKDGSADVQSSEDSESSDERKSHKKGTVVKKEGKDNRRQTSKFHESVKFKEESEREDSIIDGIKEELKRVTKVVKEQPMKEKAAELREVTNQSKMAGRVSVRFTKPVFLPRESKTTNNRLNSNDQN